MSYLNNRQQPGNPGFRNSEHFPSSYINNGLDEANGSKSSLAIPSFQQGRDAGSQLVNKLRALRAVIFRFLLLWSSQCVFAANDVSCEQREGMWELGLWYGCKFSAEHLEIRGR